MELDFLGDHGKNNLGINISNKDTSYAVFTVKKKKDWTYQNPLLPLNWFAL